MLRTSTHYPPDRPQTGGLVHRAPKPNTRRLVVETGGFSMKVTPTTMIPLLDRVSGCDTYSPYSFDTMTAACSAVAISARRRLLHLLPGCVDWLYRMGAKGARA